MRGHRRVIAIAAAVAIVTATSAADTGAVRDDPFAWLEQVDGERAMAWVRSENAKTAAVLARAKGKSSLTIRIHKQSACASGAPSFAIDRPAGSLHA